MADRVLFISWDGAVHGREERGLEVFNEAMGFYGRCQQDGRLERFDVCIMRPSGGPEGYIALYGTADQLATLREDAEFTRLMLDAGLIVERLRMLEGFTGDGIAQQMSMYMEAIGKVPQHAG